MSQLISESVEFAFFKDVLSILMSIVKPNGGKVQVHILEIRNNSTMHYFYIQLKVKNHGQVLMSIRLFEHQALLFCRLLAVLNDFLCYKINE